MGGSIGASRQGGKTKIIILVAVLVLVLVGAGVTLALYLGGVFSPAAATAKGKTAAAVVKPKGPPIYIPMDPPLVVNFERNGQIGFLQVTMQLMTREKDVVDKVKSNMPVIRNNLLLLIGSKTYKDVDTLAGKEKLRNECMATVNKVLQQVGAHGEIAAVYFTGFVMQ